MATPREALDPIYLKWVTTFEQIFSETMSRASVYSMYQCWIVFYISLSPRIEFDHSPEIIYSCRLVM